MNPELDPLPIIGGVGGVGLVILLGRFLNSWLQTILSERKDLGSIYKDALDRQTTEIASMKIQHESDIAVLQHRVSLSEQNERDCLKNQSELLTEIRGLRMSNEELRGKVVKVYEMFAGKGVNIDESNP